MTESLNDWGEEDDDSPREGIDHVLAAIMSRQPAFNLDEYFSRFHQSSPQPVPSRGEIF